MDELKQEFENSVQMTEDERILKFEFSSNDEDYTGDIVHQNFDLSRFRKNPVFLYNHDADSLPIGKVIEITNEGNRTTGTVEFWLNDSDESTWSETDKLANTVYKQYRDGFLKGVSIRIKPLDFTINPQSKNGKGLIVKESMLLEVSATSIPMNEDSLKKHLKSTEVEEINNTDEGETIMENKLDIAKSLLDGAEVERTEDTIAEDLVKHLRDGSMSKTLQEAVGEDGGVLIPENRKNEIIKTSYVSNPMRALAGFSRISQGNSLKVPVERESANLYGYAWRDETTDTGETNTSKFDLVDIPVSELYAEPWATRFMVKDVAFDLEGYISAKSSEAINKGEAVAFLKGDGADKPEGLLNGITADVTYVAGAVAKSDLVDMVKALPEQYQEGATFQMNNATYIELANLEYTDGRSILAEEFDAPIKDTILGYNVVINPEMDDLGTAGNQPIIFGNMAIAYHIVEHEDKGIIRDDITKKGFIKYYTWERVGGKVLVRGAYVVAEETA